MLRVLLLPGREALPLVEDQPLLFGLCLHASCGLGMGEMNSARRRRSMTFRVGWPSSSSSQWRSGYAYGELRIGLSKNWLFIVGYRPPPTRSPPGATAEVYPFGSGLRRAS